MDIFLFNVTLLAGTVTLSMTQCRRRLLEDTLWGMTDTVNDSDCVEGGYRNILYGA